MKRIYLSCKKDGVECSYGEQGSQTYEDQKIVKTRSELAKFFKNKHTDIVLCSSSMDFPSEYTKNTHVINLCNWIRSGNF